MPDDPTGLLVWWSTNTRCAAVLARAAITSGVPTAIVLDPAAPRPGADTLAGGVVVERPRTPLTRGELAGIVAHTTEALGVPRLVLAPTSEYLLDTVHAQWGGDVPHALTVPCTAGVGYRDLSSKRWGAARLAAGRVLPPPAEVAGGVADLRFVAKPRVNVVDGVVLKPFLVDDAQSLARFDDARDAYFAQAYVPGPSFYWCAYRGRDGAVTDYFQRNLLQRPGGDSIVLAAAQDPPGHEALRAELRGLLEGVGFVGPAMVEMRGDPPRFIELNPRFWGPLLLDVLSGGGVLDAFLRDLCGVELRPFLAAAERDRARLYVVPSALQEVLVTVSGPAEAQVSLPPPLREMLFAAAGYDPTGLGGDW